MTDNPHRLDALQLARQELAHDGMSHIPWDGTRLTSEQFVAAVRASDSYAQASQGRRAYIDASIPRLYRIFANLELFRDALHGPTLDVASGWGILYPAWKGFLQGALPYAIAEMFGWSNLVIDGDAIEGSKFECERDVLEFADGKFGVVCFFDCIEHLIVDPMWPLLEFNRVLRTGGRIAISTPNAAAAYKITQIAQGQNPATESHIKPSSIYQRHNREWTVVELRQALECCGFGNLRYSTNAQCLGKAELDSLAHLDSCGLIGMPLQYYGPEIFVIGEKVRHVTLDTPLPKDERWPSWLYSEVDAYRKRPKTYPIVVSDDYS